MKPESPKEISEVRNSSKVNFHMKQDYIPIMKGSKYAVTMEQLEYNGALHPDAHLLFVKIQ